MREHFDHKKSLGQHFLTSGVVPNWMCDAADLHPGETVLEVGPGTGALTVELLRRGTTVLALETDNRAIAVLQERFEKEIASGQLAVLASDVRTLDLSTLPQLGSDYKVVANIPYYLSGFLFRTFLSAAHQPNTLVFLVQKEVAKRVTSTSAKGDKESLLSLSVQAYGTPTYVKTVSRGHFNPPPKVDSGIVLVRNISKQHFSNLDETLFFTLLHLGFGQKRKQLIGNLAARYDRGTLEKVFVRLGIDPRIRAEAVPLKVWLQLTQVLSTEI